MIPDRRLAAEPLNDPVRVGTSLASQPLVFTQLFPLLRRPQPPLLSSISELSVIGIAMVAAAAGVVLVAVAGVVGYWSTYLSGAAAERIGAEMRSAVFERLLSLPLPFHDRHRSGDLVSRLLSDVPRVQDALVATFDSLIPSALGLIGMFAVLLAVDVGLAVAALAVVPLLALQIRLSRRRIRAVEREARARQGGVAAQATEVLRHVRAVRALGREDEQNRQFRREVTSAAQAGVTALTVHARFSPLADLILALGGGLILVLGVAKVMSGEITVGILLVLLTYASGLYDPIRSLTRLSTVLARAAASRERLEEILNANDRVADAPGALPLPAGPKSIALHEVTFGYEPDVPVLRDVSLEIPAGETLCIVGPTGVGKSTLLSLLLRLYDPIHGSVTMGGIDLRQLTPRSLRARISIVPQDAWILNGTIADNIRFGRSAATEEQIRVAAKTALVDEFALRLPQENDTVVGESGLRLSGGQRRRVALARALLRDAQVLLLDEPTSGLDAESEAAVIRALRGAAAGRTMIIVSHRLSVAAIATRVVVLREGRVLESGSPEELIGGGGAFARMWNEQVLSSARLRPKSGLRVHHSDVKAVS